MEDVCSALHWNSCNTGKIKNNITCIDEKISMTSNRLTPVFSLLKGQDCILVLFFPLVVAIDFVSGFCQ